MRRRLTTALVVAMTGALLPSGAHAWLRFPPVVPPAPAGEPEPAPPPEAVPAETPPPPATVAPPETPSPPPIPAPPPGPPVEAPPPAAALPPPLEPPLQPWGQPEGVPVLETPAREPVSRPKLSAAVGMGFSYDSVGFTDGNTRRFTSFFTVLGIGDGVGGFDLSAFASSPSREDRYNSPDVRIRNSPVDRFSVDGFGVFRPGALLRPDDPSFETRVLRALAAELGLGFERDGRSPISGTRFLVHLGARADVPVPYTDVRLRLAVRRGVGLYTPKLSSSTTPLLEVGDSAAEVYAAIVSVF